MPTDAADEQLIRRVRAVANTLHCMDWGVRCAVLRDHGQEALERVESAMLTAHQKRHFLPGLTKLGLDEEESDAVRCAKYHCLSNALGGLRTGYAVESPTKAWVFYRTPYYLDSPWSPGVGMAVLKPSFMEVSMRSWHANNGSLLGNPRLGFAVTHLVMRGDALDAGYFFEDDEGATFRTRWGERLPDASARREAKFGGDWPEMRRVYSWRNFAVGYFGGRFPHLLRELGADPSKAAVTHGVRIALLQKREELMDALSASSGHVLCEEFHRAAGCEVRLERRADGGPVLVIARSRIHEAAEHTGYRTLRPIEEAIETAWSSVVSEIDPGMELSVLSSPGRGDSDWRWCFGRSSAA